jgi:hypothetical protein
LTVDAYIVLICSKLLDMDATVEVSQEVDRYEDVPSPLTVEVSWGMEM